MQAKKRNGITALVSALIVIIIILVGIAGYAFLYPPAAATQTVTSTVTGTGGSTQTVTSTVTGTGGSSPIGKLKVGLIEPITPADNSWNYQAESELKKLQSQYGFTLSFSENQVSGTTAQPVAQQWASQGYGVIFLQGIQYQVMASTIAPSYPNTLFVCVDCTAANASNVYRIWLDISGGGFVLGAMAGMLSQTNKFGLVGGGFVPSIWGGHEGFKAGVLYTDPHAATATFYNKFEAFAWSDSAGAQTDATNDYTNGADIVFSSGDGIDVGVLGAAMARPTSPQVWATNVYTNLTAIAPANNRILLGSIVVNWAALYNKALIDYVTHNYSWGFVTANMASGMVQVQPGPNVPAKIRAAGLALQSDVVVGTISLYFKADSTGTPLCFNTPTAAGCADTYVTVPSGGGTPTSDTAAQFSYLPTVASLP
ncbi:MAG: BMP family ABC transporter substrate-binding protein [Nitrososphaerota archaeon]|nr:BMP family ABC transporter substrate-binding protein [Nitrososphaerota archaeon]